MSKNNNPTAALILIGNELLSGRTPDANLNYIARRLDELGITLQEARVIADDHDAIVTTINTLRKQADYVFTTGGIGPTHDDITMACVAEAFGVELERHVPTVESFKQSYGDRATPATFRMADFPQGAQLVNNPITKHPGAKMHNVFVLAGIPKICQAMFEACVPLLQRGEIFHSRSLDVMATEGQVSEDLEIIQQRFNELDIGSYPFRVENVPGTSLVARGTDATQVDDAYQAFVQLADELGAKTLNT